MKVKHRIVEVITLVVATALIVFLVKSCGKVTQTVSAFFEPEVRYGTRSYYAKDRYLLGYECGEYLGDCFIPYGSVLRYLGQAQIDSIVLVETIIEKNEE